MQHSSHTRHLNLTHHSIIAHLPLHSGPKKELEQLQRFVTIMKCQNINFSKQNNHVIAVWETLHHSISELASEVILFFTILHREFSSDILRLYVLSKCSRIPLDVSPPALQASSFLLNITYCEISAKAQNKHGRNKGAQHDLSTPIYIIC